ncbi:MAG: hypothetical protein V3V61_05150, partial [Gammaproteobacteria bacterium]
MPKKKEHIRNIKRFLDDLPPSPLGLSENKMIDLKNKHGIASALRYFGMGNTSEVATQIRASLNQLQSTITSADGGKAYRKAHEALEQQLGELRQVAKRKKPSTSAVKSKDGKLSRANSKSETQPKGSHVIDRAQLREEREASEAKQAAEKAKLEAAAELKSLSEETSPVEAVTSAVPLPASEQASRSIVAASDNQAE